MTAGKQTSAPIPTAAADFTGQNGKVDNFRPLLQVKCSKHGKKHYKVRHERNKHHRAKQRSVRP